MLSVIPTPILILALSISLSLEQVDGSETTTNFNGYLIQVRYANDGKLFATSARDGAIKLWDAVAMTCTATLPNAHQGNRLRAQYLIFT